MNQALNKSLSNDKFNNELQLNISDIIIKDNDSTFDK